MFSGVVNMTVDQVLRQYPKSETVFRLLDIPLEQDSTVASIAETRGWPANALAAALGSLPADKNDATDSDSTAPQLYKAIVSYICTHYHQTLDVELQHVETLFTNALATSRPDSREHLQKLRSVFARLGKQLRAHVTIEEDLLFPSLFREAWTGSAQEGIGEQQGTLDEMALREMDKEHDVLVSCLRDIRELTGCYGSASSEDGQLIELYEELKRFDLRLRQHAAVEHDFLWPTSAISQEAIAGQTWYALAPDVERQMRQCPWTQQPCEEGYPDVCSRFWDCAQKVIDERWSEATGDTDRSSGS